MLHQSIILFVLSFLALTAPAFAASKDKRHSHDGVLDSFDGKHLPYEVDAAQLAKLDAGQQVVLIEKAGSGGRGTIIQDVEASPDICMDRITDLRNYYKMVPKVKSIDIYSEETLANGTALVGAQFNTQVFFVTFTFFLKLKQEPRYNTYSWTLDYQYSSDFDDNTGFWQAMPHPKKAGWTRILYSTGVKVFSWVPGPVVSFLTNTALTESTNWVKKESEKLAREAAKTGKYPSYKSNLPDISGCYHEDANGAKYETHCANNVPDVAPKVDANESVAASEEL